jgi:hypothetical protein
MWPLTMAIERGGFFASVFSVSPGKFCTKPFLSAMASVDSAGEKKRSVGERYQLCRVADPTADIARSLVIGGGGLGWGKSKCHRRVAAVRVPWSSNLCWWETVTACAALNVTSHPASHSCRMDRSVWEAKSRTMWTWRAAAGRWGMSKLVTCVEYMMLPLGLWMASGLDASRLLTTGSAVVSKWAVLLVLAMVEKVGGLLELSKLVEETC